MFQNNVRDTTIFTIINTVYCDWSNITLNQPTINITFIMHKSKAHDNLSQQL